MVGRMFFRRVALPCEFHVTFGRLLRGLSARLHQFAQRVISPVIGPIGVTSLCLELGTDRGALQMGQFGAETGPIMLGPRRLCIQPLGNRIRNGLIGAIGDLAPIGQAILKSPS